MGASDASQYCRSRASVLFAAFVLLIYLRIGILVRRFTLAFIVVLAALAGLVAARDVEQGATNRPLGASAVFGIASLPGRSEEALARIEAFAHARNVQLGFFQPSVDGGPSARSLYLVPFDDAFDASTTDFGRFIETAAKPISALPDSDIRGGWAVFGSENDAVAFQSFLEDSGFRFFDEGGATFPRLVSAWTGIDALLLPATLVLLAAAIAMTDVVLRARRYAIGRLHGLSLVFLFLKDAAAPTAAFLAGAVGTAGVIVAALAATGTTHALASLLAQTLMYVGLSAAAFFGAFAVMFLLVNLIPALRILSGEYFTGSITWCGYALRILTLASATSVALGIPGAWDAQNQWRAASEASEELGDIASIVFGWNGTDPEDNDEISPSMQAWLTDKDLSGQLLYSFCEDNSLEGLSQCDLVVANEEFARTEGLLDAGADAALAAGTAALLTPSGVEPDAALRQRAAGALLVDLPIETFLSARSGPVLNMAAGAGAFASGAGSTALIDNPAVYVVPAGLAGDYISIQGKDALALRGTRATIDETRADPLLTRAVTSVADFRQGIAHAASVARTSLLSAIAALALSLLVLLISSVAIAYVHTRARAKTLFVKKVHGWAFPAAFPVVLGAEAVLLGGCALWSLRSSQSGLLEMSPMLTAEAALGRALDSSLLAFVVLLLAGIVFVATLALNYRTIVARTMKEG